MEDMTKWSDKDLIDALRMVDEGPEEVDKWEANFIENILSGKYRGRLSRAQKAQIQKLTTKYLGW